MFGIGTPFKEERMPRRGCCQRKTIRLNSIDFLAKPKPRETATQLRPLSENHNNVVFCLDVALLKNDFEPAFEPLKTSAAKLYF